MGKKTICLCMIVKNEAHVIEQTLQNITPYIDTWVISDTGSTDGTQTIIKNYFKKVGISGNLYEDKWVNFGHNRSIALKHAYNKSDYVFIQDADDLIVGNFVLPSNMTADSYLLQFGTVFTYTRPQLLNNCIKWRYRGVLHEFVEPVSKKNIRYEQIKGDYYIDSRRLGSRNNDPQKYQKDAKILVDAIESKSEPDLIPRYCLYAGNSYKDCQQWENAITYYKKYIECGKCVDEKHVSWFEIGNCMQRATTYKESDIVGAYMNSFKILPERIEGLYAMGKYYMTINKIDKAYNCFKLAAKAPHPQTFILFVHKYVYDYDAKFYLAKTANLLSKKEEAIDIINQLSNLESIPQHIKNFKFDFKLEGYDYYEDLDSFGYDIPELYKGVKPLEEMKKIADADQRCVGFNTWGYYKYAVLDKTKYINLHNQYNQAQNGLFVKKETQPISDIKYSDNLPLTIYPTDIIKTINKNNQSNKLTLTITTCKRYDLFVRTINSFLNCCEDYELIDRWICVDDNSSESDRQQMITKYPFFEFYFKSDTEKGHHTSMNMIQQLVSSPYILHLEDDWLFIEKCQIIKPALQILEATEFEYLDSRAKQASEGKEIAQVLFNKNYMETVNMVVYGGYEMQTNGIRFLLHEFYPSNDHPLKDKPNCAYWPHYSFRPSIFKRKIFEKLGAYETEGFFERKYADKYLESGFVSVFYDKVLSIHIGKKTWERDVSNAYTLNNVSQFDTNKNDSTNTPDRTIDPNYIFLKNLDSFEGDITYTDKSIPELIQIANFLPDCVGFNTYGYLKNQINDKLIKLNQRDGKTDGLMIKKTYLNQQIICLNLEKRTDRRNRMKELFETHNLKYKFYNSILGTTVKPTPHIIKLFDGNDFGSRAGVVGCALSHINVWKNFITDSLKDYQIIFEDDVEIDKDFKTHLENIQMQLHCIEWDVIFLGYTMYDADSNIKQLKYYSNQSDIYVRELDTDNYIGGFFGYMISRSGVAKLSEYIDTYGIRHGIDYLIKKCPNLKCFESSKLIVKSDWVKSLDSTVDSDIQKNLEYVDIYSDDNFKYYRLLDSIGSDIKYIPNQTVAQLKQIALENPEYKAFNTLGFIKSSVGELSQTQYFKNIYDGIYVKN
jgi:GR25 family glycosyltransferase involved in LPS biosynthesis